MIRRCLVFIILTAMVLHTTSRMGLLSLLYQNRHEIAFQAGLITEIPIAVCNSDYDFSNELQIIDHGDDNSTLPPAFTPVREVVLFFHDNLISVKPSRRLLETQNFAFFPERKYSSPGKDIFHPPS